MKFDSEKEGELENLPIFSFLMKYDSEKMIHHNFVSTLLNDLFGIQTRSGCVNQFFTVFIS